MSRARFSRGARAPSTTGPARRARYDERVGISGQIAEPELGVVAILNFVGAGQALVFACALLGVRRGGSRANRILAALLVVIAVMLVWNVLLHTRYLLWVPHLAQLHVPLQLLIGPLVWLHARALLQRDRAFAIRDLLHAVPAVACTLYLTPFYLQDAAEKQDYLRAALDGYPLEWRVRTAIVLALGGVYIVALGSLPGLLPRRDTRDLADPDRFWARVWAGAFAVILVAGATRYFLDYGVRSNLVVPLLLSALVNAAVFLRLRAAPVAMSVPEALPLAKKYERSTLTADRAERYLERLIVLMETERCYMVGDLSLSSLADRLAISPHHLSQLLNERIGKSFNDFVNSYRVDEARRRLVDPKDSQFSILAIAESAGFTSKSAFNAAFKKHTGMTPSEWRKLPAGERKRER